jgi:hypothetical protein
MVLSGISSLVGQHFGERTTLWYMPPDEWLKSCGETASAWNISTRTGLFSGLYSGGDGREVSAGAAPRTQQLEDQMGYCFQSRAGSHARRECAMNYHAFSMFCQVCWELGCGLPGRLELIPRDQCQRLAHGIRDSLDRMRSVCVPADDGRNVWRWSILPLDDLPPGTTEQDLTPSARDWLLDVAEFFESCVAECDYV